MHKFITTTVNLSDTLMITQQMNKRPFNDLFLRTTWVNQYQKQNTTLDFNAARDDGGFEMAVAYNWTICKQSAIHSRQRNSDNHTNTQQTTVEYTDSA